MLAHLYRVVQSTFREHIYKSIARNGAWRTTRRAILDKQPTCEACGSTKRLQVHHRQPFHLHPELELKEDNLIVLCMDVNECHLHIGHSSDFHAYNPNVSEDAKEALEHPDRLSSIVNRARLAIKYTVRNPFGDSWDDNK